MSVVASPRAARTRAAATVSVMMAILIAFPGLIAIPGVTRCVAQEGVAIGTVAQPPRDSRSNDSAQRDSAQRVAIPVETTEFSDVREGHVLLQWENVPQASSYEVRDPEGRVFYQGVASEAFLSGLPDGEHRYTVRGLDDEGVWVAQSEQPIVVTVTHWPLLPALALFAVGCIVVICIMSVIIRGADEPTASSPLSPDPSPKPPRAAAAVGDA